MRALTVGFVMLLSMALGPAHAGGTRSTAKFDRTIVAGALDLALFDEAVAIHSNAARRLHGQPPLKRDRRLHRAAADHAANMAILRTHSHRLPVAGQERLAHRMARNGVRYRTAGENIGMEKVLRLLAAPVAMGAKGCAFTYAGSGAPVPTHTYATLAQSAVERWMASPKHRASLLSPAFRRIGSGVAIDPDGPACGDVYLVQDFSD